MSFLYVPLYIIRALVRNELNVKIFLEIFVHLAYNAITLIRIICRYVMYMAGVVVLSENFLLRHLSRDKRHDFDIIAQN